MDDKICYSDVIKITTIPKRVYCDNSKQSSVILSLIHERIPNLFSWGVCKDENGDMYVEYETRI